MDIYTGGVHTEDIFQIYKNGYGCQTTIGLLLREEESFISLNPHRFAVEFVAERGHRENIAKPNFLR